MLNKLDANTFFDLMSTLELHRYDWNYVQFREYRKAKGVERETIIPWRMMEHMLQYRYAEFNPDDYGLEGKFSEVEERIELAIMKERDLKWVDFRAHKAGRRDLSYGKKAVEKKTGAGDWLVSFKACTVEGIVREYSRKTSLIHWQVEDLGLDITCQWNELMAYLGQYVRKQGGQPMGAGYWFKNYVKPSEDGDRWIVEIQTYRTSGKKLEYLRNCPYNHFGK